MILIRRIRSTVSTSPRSPITRNKLSCNVTIPVPTSIANVDGVENGKLIVTTNELRGVFDAVNRMIFQLIVGQIEKVQEAPGNLDVSSILLVGGFGSSEYLRKEIESHLADIGEGIAVIQPVNAYVYP